MARTAPVPNFPAIPGMNPGIFLLGGGGDSGGSGAGGKKGASGKQGAGGKNGGKDATGGGKSAPDPQKFPDCGTASHPVDVVTGRAFTHPLVDIRLPGPLPLLWARVCSSAMAQRDTGLGWGWGHSLGWEIEVRRRRILVWNDQGVSIPFPMVAVGHEALGPWGWVLRREEWGFVLDADDGVFRRFAELRDDGAVIRLSAIEDRNQNRITLSYESGRLVEVQDSAGRILKVLSTPAGQIGSIRACNAVSRGQWVELARYTYDDGGHLLAVTDADGFTARYGYDEDHRLTEDTDRTGLCFHFVYDGDGRCVESWGDYPGREDPSLAGPLPAKLHDGTTRSRGIHHCRFVYAEDGSSEVIDSSQVRRFYGNEHGLLDRWVEGGNVITATYRGDGHQSSRTDASGGTTVFERDARGRLTRITDPLGRTTSVERGPDGLPRVVTDPAGAVSAAALDDRGNLVTYTDANGGTKSFAHDARGLPVAITTAQGAVFRIVHDEQGNRTAVALPNGGTWQRQFDAFGRCIEEVDPLGASTRYTYSPRGDLTAVRNAVGDVTRYAYDGEGHLIEIVSPQGAATAFSWGGYHKLCARKDANGHTVRLRYSVEGELLEVHNEQGEAHRLEYDPSGRLIAEDTFDGRKLRYRNDVMGRLVRFTRGDGQSTFLEYDAAGQLVKREYPDGAVEAYEYDDCGSLVRATRDGLELAFDRDALGRVIGERQTLDGHTVEVRSELDLDGRRRARTTSLGHTEEISRDSLGLRARTVLDGTTVIEHDLDAVGRERARRLPGGARIESARDGLGRLVRQRVLSPSAHLPMAAGRPDWVGDEQGILADKVFQYSPDGELAETWDRQVGRTEYRYDPVGQLLAMVPEKARAELFRYDATGNLHETGQGDGARTYARGNRIERKGTKTYLWGEDGQLVEKRALDAAGNLQTWKYQWNGAGLLDRVTTPDGTVVEFSYDVFARRIEKRVLANRAIRKATRFVWDGHKIAHEVTRVASEHGDPILETKTYCFEDGGFAPIAQLRSDEDWEYFLTDDIGTTEGLVDGQGRTVARLDRGAWNLQGPAGRTSLRFPGQYEDEETGLAYNRYRYYDPETASFLSADPWGLVGGIHGFRYARNAFSWADPFGLSDFFRGGDDMTPKTMRDGKSEFRSPDPAKPDVQSRGISLYNNQDKTDKFGGSNKITSLPEGLAIEQRGKDKEHFEIVAKKPMTEAEYKEKLKQVGKEKVPPRACPTGGGT